MQQQLVSSKFKRMLSELSANKVKGKNSTAGQTSHLATYQGEIIRKSICHGPKRQKSAQRLMTQTSEKGICGGSDMKKLIKQFRMPFKSTSPHLKKKSHNEHPSANHKPQPTKTKKTKAALGQNIPKHQTETGPLIRKVASKRGDREKQRPIQSGVRVEECRSKVTGAKKLNQRRSADKMTIGRGDGTFDSTPKNMGQSDVELVGLVGQGTFGKVFKGKLKRTGQWIAVKRVFQDPKYKNREIEMVKMLEGDFTMRVLGTYLTTEEGQQFLNIVMDYYECDLYAHIKASKKGIQSLDFKVMAYQLFRGLMYIHSLGICHRDIKPHNLLLNQNRLVICDFGSAKVLTHEPNLPYICSRCYRAPELIFGATHYTTMIDVWSAGCVILEMINGVPLFIGQSSIDHLIEIIKVLGTPTKTQVIDMNPQYDLNDYKFPKVKRKEWKQVFPKCDPLLLDFISQIMIYSPKQRLNAAEALAHEFFDELREQEVGRDLQKKLGVSLFDFSYGEVRGHEHLLPKLIPQWVQFY